MCCTTWGSGKNHYAPRSPPTPFSTFYRVTDVHKEGEVVAGPGPHRQHLLHPPCDEMMSRGDRGGGVIEALLRPSFYVWILRSCRPPPCPVLPFCEPYVTPLRSRQFASSSWCN
jgi:hypothetical protein